MYFSPCVSNSLGYNITKETKVQSDFKKKLMIFLESARFSIAGSARKIYNIIGRNFGSVFRVFGKSTDPD